MVKNSKGQFRVLTEVKMNLSSVILLMANNINRIAAFL